MKRINLFFSLIIIAVFIISCDRQTSLNIDGKAKVALVLKMNTGYHWGTIKQGADTAAREFNVNLYFYAPLQEDDVKGQIDLVNQALDENVDALILAASDFKELVGVTEKAYDKKIPVIIIESLVDTDKIHSYIATDNLDAGRKAGNVLLDIAGTECNVAIMNFVKGTSNADDREKGLLQVIGEHPGIKVVAKEYCLSDINLASKLTKEIISKHDNLNAIVALNSISSEGVAQAIEELGLAGKVKIIAFDSTTREIDYLEEGIIQATVIQNPFSMGYLGVKYAVEMLNGNKIDEYFNIEAKVITKENMYLKENQKLLFPFIK
ncbi:MAG: substrate-binding domain-containing protein [Acetivibrionales bacterium]